MALTRRELVDRCLSTGALLLASPGLAQAAESLADSEKLTATPGGELGPFFKPGAPTTTSLVVPGDHGLALDVSGRVLDTRGEPLADAVIEVWQANNLGLYDNQGYHYRGRLVAGVDGGYRFHTLLPGHYPARVAQHIHYRVSAPSAKTLVTQLYFATDPVFEGDPAKNYVKDPVIGSRELIRPVTLTTTGSSILAAVTFETVLLRA
jgi:protocatechuate 3,4-dioxygenase beta subunit